MEDACQWLLIEKLLIPLPAQLKRLEGLATLGGSCCLKVLIDCR